MKFMFAVLALLSGTPENVDAVEHPDSLMQVVVNEVYVEGYATKRHYKLEREPISSSVVGESMLAREHILSVKDLSALVPNFFQPDYGSKMTSSIYVRGFGARIDQPVIGVTVDGVPYLNKNNYDFDMLDVARIELLRGPQSTLYGRNTMGGQMNIYTLSPLNYEGARVGLEYGSANTFRGKASYYGRSESGKFGYMVGGYYNRTDGFFENAYNGETVDWGSSSGGRVRLVGRLGRGWELENIAQIGYADEGGYAYAKYDAEKGSADKVNYNHPSRYMRMNISDGLILSHAGEKYKFTATTSYQYTHDKMNIDNDFTPKAMFTLIQEQREHAVTEDIVFRTNEGDRRWKWLTGVYGFYKTIDMSAPVSFQQDGISDLILGNMPAMVKQFLTINPFDLESDFDIPTYGAAVYHESSLRAGKRWRFTAGLRLDYEKSTMDYDNFSEVIYSFNMPAMRPGMDPININNKPVPVSMQGKEELDYLELLPKFAVNFTTGAGDLYATVTRGYKAGGFNTQIFSDILQNKMKTALMADAMGSMGGGQGGRPSSQADGQPSGQPSATPSYDEASVTTYKPEYSWNYEVGGHLKFAKGRVGVDFAAFWIECRDQQLTVFPDGDATGRMMSNAGRSRSRGAEISASWDMLRLMSMSHLRLTANYGFTHAKFVEYDDFVDAVNAEGKAERVEVSYAGNYLPYAPQHTASVGLAYNCWIGGRVLDEITVSASWQGAGKIYWNEANTLSQNFYSQLNASLELRKGDFSLGLWGKNLTDTEFNTFYFRSVGSDFISPGKPIRWGISLGFAM
ncbi:MAG: TonB-dependent receptor [Alistipes sp.]|nr:TonB-dependent receptor [Alistipes sp.]